MTQVLPQQQITLNIGRPGRGRRGNQGSAGRGNVRNQNQGMRDTRPGGQRIPGPGQRAHGAPPSQYGNTAPCKVYLELFNLSFPKEIQSRQYCNVLIFSVF